MWEPEDVAKIISNPTFCLKQVNPDHCIPKDPVISEDQWIECIEKAIKEEGVKPVMKRLLDSLKEPITYCYRKENSCLVIDPSIGSGSFSAN